jgi:DNA-binding LytR/AlgR family response regulator
MRIVLIEDERPAREKLAAAIRAAAPDAEVVAELSGVAESFAWLDANPQPDLLFLDIQLADGLSFDILNRSVVSCPVIFVTAYDEHLLRAFESNGIDYLLKPVRAERVSAAIAKYRMLRKHFSAPDQQPKRDRVLVRKGIDYVSVRLEDIAYVFTSDKLVFLVTRTGTRYLLDRPIAELEAECDATRFFRANRAFLIHIDSVVRCRPHGKGKLALELRPPIDEPVVISQERAAAFRAWLGA